MFLSIDDKDLTYVIAGIAFLCLAIFPIVKGTKIISAPIMFVTMGALLSMLPVNIPLIGEVVYAENNRVFEHITELLVILSLASAGLAVDRPVGWKSWKHTWILILLVMPCTMAVITLLGVQYAALPLATAILCAAVIAPTDPVLARSVQVEGPNKGEENDVNVSLTTEAGLNDGLAFPFVYLAIATLSVNSASGGMDNMDWLFKWASYDLLYRVFIGSLIGYISGMLLSSIISHLYKETPPEDFKAGLILFTTVFTSYGVAECFEGYGFLAVFVAALTGRKIYASSNKDDHVQKTHYFCDEIEQILMTLLLLWLGYYAATDGLQHVTIIEIMLAANIVIIIRPVIAYLCLLPTKGSSLDRFAIAFLGIRGIGTYYYLSYAQSQYEFENIDAVWRIATLCVLISIALHGMFAQHIMRRLSNNHNE